MANKTVLCFGDSNTFGYDPQGVASGTRFRYPVDVRWPGVLHELLGPDWRIVEEGLCGRSTVHRDPFEGGLCGLDELPMALATWSFHLLASIRCAFRMKLRNRIAWLRMNRGAHIWMRPRCASPVLSTIFI